MATLALESASVRPDGRVVEAVFSGPATDGVGVPDWGSAYAVGARLAVDGGPALEPMGTVVSRRGDELVWTSSFLVADGARVLTFDDPSVTLTGPEGLFRDDHGNLTAALTTAPAENLSLVDADGFTTEHFERGDGGVTLYVSSSQGRDDRTFNQAQDPRTPFRTLDQALEMLRDNGQDGRGAAVRLLRGDAFIGNVVFNLSGQDRRHPFVLEDYWFDYGDGSRDPGTRPVIKADWSRRHYMGLRITSAGRGGMAPGVDHVVIRRIKLRAVNRSGENKNSIGIQMLTGGTNWTIDDVEVSNFSTNVAVQGYDAPFHDVTVLRSIITDAHLNRPPALGKFDAAQGLYASKVDGLLVSQTTLDRNGRTTSDLKGRHMYSHNIYLTAAEGRTGPATLWGNVIRGGGSHGVHMRSGGVMAYNYLGRNAISVELSGVGGTLTRNVVEAAENISSKTPRGWGLGISSTFGGATVSVVEQNFVIGTLGDGPRALFAIQGDEGNQIELGVFRNNTVAGGGVLRYDVYDAAAPRSIRYEANVIDSGVDNVVSTRVDASAGWDWLDSDHTAFNATDLASPFGNLAVDLSGWNKLTGAESHSVMAAPRYVNGRARLADFSRRVGGPDTETAYVNRLRGRRPGEWDTLNDMLRLYDFYAEQFQPTNLAGLGDGVRDYYGAVDYRPSGPRLRDGQDTGVSASDLLTRVNQNLGFLVDRSLADSRLELLRDGEVVDTATGNARAAVTLVDSGPIPDGIHVYAVRQTRNGAVVTSAGLTVTVDRTAPDAPPEPDLLDIGLDLLRSLWRPTFDVTADDAVNLVELLRRPAGSLDDYEVAASRVGSGIVEDQGILVAGVYDYVVRVTDLAGNVSTLSARRRVTIL